MDIDKLYKLLTMVELLAGHPRLASMRKLVNHEIDAMMVDSDKEAEELDAKLKADKESEANARARKHQDGAPVPSPTARAFPASQLAESNPGPIPYRDNYDGVPGPAEPADSPTPTIDRRPS